MRLDPKDGLLLTVLPLVGIGTVMVYSSSAVTTSLDREIQDGFLYLRRQLVWIALAVAGMALGARLDYRRLLRHDALLFWVTAALLALTLVPGIGTAYHGARRWLRFAGLGFQPSDLAKLTVIVTTAAFVVRYQDRLHEFRRGFLRAVAPVLLLVALIAREPDLGTSLFLLVIGGTVLFIGGLRVRHLAPLALAGIPALVAVMYFRFDHIKDRVAVWLDPASDPQGKGHQIHQSLVALGSGGWTGLGLGEAPSKRFYLPEESTDFIFAILGQEFGFLGAAVTVALFGVLVWMGILVARRAADLFGSLLATGITLALGLQAAINLAVVTGSVPTKGISLPLISFGGSSMFFSLIGVGLLMSVARKGGVHMEEERLDEVIAERNPFVEDPPPIVAVPAALAVAAAEDEAADDCAAPASAVAYATPSPLGGEGRGGGYESTETDARLLAPAVRHPPSAITSAPRPSTRKSAPLPIPYVPGRDGPGDFAFALAALGERAWECAIRAAHAGGRAALGALRGFGRWLSDAPAADRAPAAPPALPAPGPHDSNRLSPT